MKSPGSNPDSFYLWVATTNNSGYGYSFTYDPHAADDWLFDSAAVAWNQTSLVFTAVGQQESRIHPRFELLSPAATAPTRPH